MDAVMYLKEKGRMLKTNKDVVCNIECKQCPLSRERNGEYVYCTQLEFFKTEKVVEIVETWSKEHPQKTYKQDFFEKHPKAKKDANGIPLMCIVNVYGEEAEFKECEYRIDKCIVCWNRPMPEVEK